MVNPDWKNDIERELRLSRVKGGNEPNNPVTRSNTVARNLADDPRIPNSIIRDVGDLAQLSGDRFICGDGDEVESETDHRSRALRKSRFETQQNANPDAIRKFFDKKPDGPKR